MPKAAYADSNSDVLAGISLFASLKMHDRDELGELLRTMHLESSQTLFWIGDQGDDFFIVRRGRMHLTVPDDDGRESTVAILQSGQFFGELSLLDGGPRTATARALSDVELLSLSRAEFLSFCRNHPDATIHIISVIASRQREMLDKLRGIKNANDVGLSKVNVWTRFADWIAATSASKTFVVGHVTAVICWVGINLVLGHGGFDPFPFLLLGMAASLEAIFLSIFVLISQNRQSEKDRIRADLD
jgi:CRP-like cAMP-binding protein